MNMTEEQLELLWKEQKGIDPLTGEMWLTPRQLREAKKLEDAWRKQDEDRKPKVSPQSVVTKSVVTMRHDGDRDIVDRLKDSQPEGTKSGYLLNDAADEIVRLRQLLKDAVSNNCPVTQNKSEDDFYRFDKEGK